MIRLIVLAFIAGVLGVLVFHQAAALLLQHLVAGSPEAKLIFGQVQPPFPMDPVSHLGVPAVLSAACWGGIWGVLLALMLRTGPMPVLASGFLFGAVVLTLAGFALAAALKGMPLLVVDRQAWLRAGLLNGAWGLGTALLLKAMALRQG
jgi:hypothetical protein